MKVYNSYCLLIVTLLVMSCTEKKGLAQSISNLQFSTNDIQDSTDITPQFVTDFNLNTGKYLNVNFTLDKPLITYLRELDSTSTDEELLSKGNFSFHFFVDDKEVYARNINTGAGLPEGKMKNLSHRVPLIYPERINYWGWYLWKRFTKTGGGDEAFTDGKHSLKIEIKAYVQNDTITHSTPLALGELNVLIEPIEVSASAIAVQTIDPLEDLILSQEPYDTSKIEALNKKIAQKKFEQITSVVVLKNNKLLIEEYFNGSNRASLHNPRSVGKTIASTMMGIAIDEGHITDENTTLNAYYDLKKFNNYTPSKDQVTLKSLLSMSSGFIGNDEDYDSPGNEELMYPTEDWVKFTLDLPIDSTKKMGVDYQYFTAGAVVLGDVIHQNVPGGLVDYTKKKLFDPMHITSYEWQFTPQEVGNTAGGLQLRSIDYAKYGQLYKNGGMWNGQQLVSSEWIAKSMSKQVKQYYSADSYYGFLLWNMNYTVNGKKYEVYLCNGNGGNKVIIFKDLPVVIVVTAQAYNMPYAHPQVDKMLTEYIIPAIINE